MRFYHVCLRVCFLLVAIHAAHAAAAPTLPRALWVWDAAVITDAAERDDLLALATRHGITTLFVHTGGLFLTPAHAASQHPVTAAQLAAFNTAAHAAGLRVHALDGDPSFCLDDGHATALARHQRAIAFNVAQTDPAARLDGFQWDNEPHGLPHWTANPAGQPNYLYGFLEVSRKLVAASRAAAVPLPPGFAAAFWLDAPERTLTYRGSTQPAAYHLIELLADLPDAHLAIMSYRDTVAGPDGTLAISENELAYAAAHAPALRVWIGQETGDFDPPYITFHEEGPAALDAAIRELSTTLATHPHASSVAGVAIHAHDYYRAMLVPQPALGDRSLIIARTPDGSALTLAFTRASRDRCVLETTPDLAGPGAIWTPLATYNPATLAWTTDTARNLTETLRPDGLVGVTCTLPNAIPAAPSLFFRVRAE